MTTDAQTPHARPAQSAQARRHGAGFRRTRGTRGELQSHARRVVGAAARSRDGQSQHPTLPDQTARRAPASWPSRDRRRRLPHAAPARQSAVPEVGHVPLDRRAPRLFSYRPAGRGHTGGVRGISEPRGLLFTGPCGVAKSWLSCALAQKACRDGYTVHYARVPRLFADLDLAHGDGRFARLFRMLVKVDLLVLDDWGPDRLSASQRAALMAIV